MIGADIGGIPELLRADSTGWSFPSADVDALAARIEEVSALPDATLNDMGRQARQLVEREFSKQRYMEGVRDVYARLGVH